MTPLMLFMLCIGASAVETAPARPNVLWISVEDISPDLGCYGDKHAVTPTIDRLAAEGVRFTRCFTHAGVCAPSRSGLITGCYPPSIGTHHMRCKGVPSDDVKCFPEYLRQAGYYCTNNVKTDYQFDAPATAWDENSNKADWRGREKGQPFFSVINFITTHESQIRDPSNATKKLVEKLTPEQRHDPATMIVPPFYPDTPVVRQDIANYYDNITAVDGQVAAVLKKLEEDGLADDTIVWFWGDHGRGMPRYKRWLYDTGLHVPLVVYVPEKWRKHVRPDNSESLKPGSTIDDLTAFVDFAPTLLSLANLAAPKHFQGQAFFGPHRAAAPRTHVYGHRDRMDETYDMIRTVRDKRFRYVRNFMPWQPYSQEIAYMDEMPTMREWRRLHAEGKLTGPQADWFRHEKPVEELYDTQTDPYETNNLAADPRFIVTLERLRQELQGWMDRIGDVGLIPEPLLDELQRPGAKSDTTAAPGIIAIPPDNADERSSFVLKCLTPGASLAYRILGAKENKADEARRWWVAHPDGAITLQPGERLEAKACRIGFKDSEVVRQAADRADIDPAPNTARPHWNSVAVDERASRNSSFIRNTPRGRPFPFSMLFTQPGTGAPSDGQQFPGMNLSQLDNSPANQFWIALRSGQFLVRHSNEATSAVERERLASGLRDITFRDTSPALSKLTAARWLCEVEEPTPHLKLLVGYLAHPQPSMQLAAITALAELGEKARPVIDDIRQATKNGEYVARVSQRALKKLEAKNVD